MKFKFILLASFFLTTQIALSQTSSLIMQSEPGDYIGQGQSYNFTESDGTFSALFNNNGSIQISFNGMGINTFSVITDPKQNVVLIPGPYENATKYPFNSPTKPGLNASGFGRSCADLVGNFTILEVELDVNNQVTRFAANFEQHCGNLSNPKLTGTIRYNSIGDMPIADDDLDNIANTIDNCINVSNINQLDSDLDGIGNSCDPVFNFTNIQMDSEIGDYIGQGEYNEYHLIDGNITALRNFDNGVTINYNGEVNWTFDFAAPGDAELTVGQYDLATRFPFQDVAEPGLSISGSGRGCNTLTGNFAVILAQYAGNGEVEKFEAVFEQHCEGLLPALFGVVRYNANISIFLNGFE